MTQVKREYLTKARLNRAARTGIREAAVRARELAEFVVLEEDGWIVRKFKDGTVEKIEKVEKVVPPAELRRKVDRFVGR